MPSLTKRPYYLTDVSEALYLDPITNEVAIRTGITGNINISGNVTIPGDISANVYKLGNINISDSSMPIDGNVIVTGGNIEVTQGTDPWIVEGNVIVSSGNINAEVTQGTDPWIVSGNVGIQGTANVQFAPAATDAFGRLRVSNPVTLFDSKSRYYEHNLFSTLTGAGGSLVYNANSSTDSLNVGTANGDYVYRETKNVFPYQPGKSLYILESFCMASSKTNLRQRVGFFTWQNGIYFEQTGSTLNMVIRSYSTGALVEDRIPQSQWNGDRLTGLGGANNPSGILLTPALDQIFWIDIEWLGVGSVRTGFIINGVFILCHTFHHANIPSNPGSTDNTTTYMTTATLPIRYEIENLGLTTGASSMRQVCSTVISEGGYNERGIIEAAGTGITPKDIGLGGEGPIPIVSIRLAPTRLDSVVVPSQIDFLSPSVDYFQYKLILNGTLGNATWAGTSSTGTVQYDTAATDITGGNVIYSGYASARTQIEIPADALYFQLGRTLSNVSDVITMTVESVGNNPDVLAQLGWTELT